MKRNIDWNRISLGVLTACGFALLYWRFALKDLATAEWIQWNLGYWSMHLAFGLWLFAGATIIRDYKSKIIKLKKEIISILSIISILLLILSIHEHWIYEVNFDEPTHSQLALSMHLERTYATPLRLYWDSGEVAIANYTSHHRAGLFAYFVSLLHDLIGFSPLNSFFANIILATGLLMAVWTTGRIATKSNTVALGAVITLCSLPLFSQMAFSSLCDMTAAMLLITFILSIILLFRNWNRSTFFFSAATGTLLSLARGESIVFLGLLAVAMLIRRIRKEPIHADWKLLLFTPIIGVALSVQIILLSNPENITQGQLETGRPVISWDYFITNYQSALHYFFSSMPQTGSLPWLGWLGLISAVTVTIMGILRRCQWGALEWSTMGTTVVYLAFYGMMLSTFWGGPETITMERFTLPLWTLAILFLFCLWKNLLIAHKAIRYLPHAGVLSFIIITIPHLTRANLFKRNYLGRTEAIAIHESVNKKDLKNVYISDMSAGFLANGIPCYSPDYIKQNPERFQTALEYGLYEKITLILHRRSKSQYFMSGKSTPEDFLFEIEKTTPIQFDCDLAYAKIKGVKQNNGNVFKFDFSKKKLTPKFSKQEEYDYFLLTKVP